MHIFRQLANLLITVSALISSTYAVSFADDIYKGIRGPTNWQIDGRVSYSKNEKGIETLANQLILKYWNGDELGVWGFASLPYKFIWQNKSDSKSDSSNPSKSNLSNPNSYVGGIGDFSFGLGPRIKTELNEFGAFHGLFYVAMAFPTGNSEKKLGTGRYDTKIGGFVTYLTPSKEFEADASFEYNFTGENSNGINPPNETNAGVIGGIALTDELRIATGATSLVNATEDYLVASRTVVRYTFSKAVHIETVGDIGLARQKIPKSNSAGLILRYNF